MVRKIILIIVFFYFLTLFQSSFFIHFSLWGMAINLVLIFIILINLFEKPEEKLGILAAFCGGFFLDILSVGNDYLFFGVYTFISLVISLFIKLILKRYVRIPVAKKF